jgi:prepilin-type processing-associated H-X9-DG protein
MANIKQYTRGIGLYSADNDDYLPYAAGWMDACAAYGVDPRGLRCPVAVASNASAFGYAFDIGLSHMNVDRITDTSREIDIYDSDLEQRNATDVGTSLPMRGRHQDRNYIGFVDGHVGYMYSGARMIERPASGQNRNSTDSNRK